MNAALEKPRPLAKAWKALLRFFAGHCQWDCKDKVNLCIAGRAAAVSGGGKTMAFEFTLHPRLAAGSYPLGTVAECRVLLKDNACFPWLLVVPEVPEGVEDLHQLAPERYAEVMELVRRVSIFLTDYFHPEKLNVACIGNQVRQMHLHIVGRNADDAAWPGTVWASDAKKPWPAEDVDDIREAARKALFQGGRTFCPPCSFPAARSGRSG